MCGRPYAGKTTLSRLLEAHAGLARHGFDEPLKEEGLDPRVLAQADWDRVYQVTYARFAAALAGGGAILDGANTRSTRDAGRRLARAAGADPILLYVDATEEQAWARWRANLERPDRDQLPEETMTLALAMFEPPEADEDAIAVPYDDLAGWVERR